MWLLFSAMNSETPKSKKDHWFQDLLIYGPGGGWLPLLLLAIIASLAAILLPALARLKQATQKSVVVYCAQDEVFAEPLFRRFERDTGIRVKPLYDSEAMKTVGLANRLLAEREHPQADVFWGNEELRTRELALRQVFRETNAWAAFGYRTRCLVFNTNLLALADAPCSLIELTNARWRGKFSLAYPMFGTTSTHFHALRQLWGETNWFAWCRALAANKPFVEEGNSGVVKRVGRGEALVGLTDSDDVVAGAREGLPVAALPPNAEALFLPNTVAIIRNCPHPDEAQRLFEWLRRPAVVEALVAAAALEGAARPTNTTALDPNWFVMLRDLDTANRQKKELFAR